MKRIALPITAALILLASSSAGAATPDAGVFRGVTSQKSTRLAIEVERGRGGRVRVEGGELGPSMDCDDGSTITPAVYLGGAKIRPGGRFKVGASSGGNYGRHGSIRLAVRLR